MIKRIQNQAGFQVVDSATSPEYFSAEELATSNRQFDIINAYNQAVTDLQTIQNTANPTNAQVVWAVQRIAQIIEYSLKYIKNDLIK